jgi:hypothetical protein
MSGVPVGLLKKPDFGKNEIKNILFKNIILKGLNSKAQGKGSKAGGRQTTTLGEYRKKENTLKGLNKRKTSLELIKKFI